MAVPKEAHDPFPLTVIEDGKVTIPPAMLDDLGLENGATLEVRLEEGTLRLLPLAPDEVTRHQHPFAALYEWFAPSRAHIAASGISQEELYADIDEAVREVRAAARARGE
ncbi:MAG: AbrB/MazE/SpoVT family DNA-binding domain-containing protein [Thermomicrobiales bacterium]